VKVARQLGFILAFALFPAPLPLEAQSRVAPGSITPAPPAPGAGRGAAPGRGFGRGGGWMVWPWGWWAAREDKPLPKPVDPEPPARAWVENKDYQPPRFNPMVTDYTDGALPAPRGESPGAVHRLAPCRVVLAGGGAVDAPWCEWRPDSVRYEDPDGRIVRLSIDLVNRRDSDRPR
jgi:hypothetical protein